MFSVIRSTFGSFFSSSGKNRSVVQVVDAGSNPVAGATVYASTMNAMFRILTDAQGCAGLPGPVDKIFSLQAEKEDLGHSEHLVFSVGMASPIILTLPGLGPEAPDNPDENTAADEPEEGDDRESDDEEQV
ncbi:MAG: hypothetical protein LBM00_00405 [Deltaproteobacteria bacterium]|jgi:hypothetical protein|nr:hypothetical protein [Deltaproteobacteria bacterium]